VPAVVVVLITGVWMVLVQSREFTELWVVLVLVAFAAAFLVGAVYWRSSSSPCGTWCSSPARDKVGAIPWDPVLVHTGVRPRMEALRNPEVLGCTDVTRWESWLADHHAQSSGIWLLIAKRGSDKASVTISDALAVALCYGWIDSQRKGYDTNHYLQRYSPRRSRSSWSRLNVERVEALTDAGRMRSPGMAEVAAAKADGRWAAAYESQRSARLPPDLAAALEQNEPARAAFERLDKTGRYAFILPVLKATTPAARVLHIRKAIAKLDVTY
jgi:uncharacterized protein YdeI (YjbR/CyaY-like superfamily)